MALRMLPEDERWEWVNELDEEMLRGGASASEFCVELMRNADLSYASGAFVACLITASATIETYLREEGYGDSKCGLYQLIEMSDFDENTKIELHDLRKNRNAWVHVADPWADNDIENEYSQGHPELENQCKQALRLMRLVVYSNPWV
jgi:hypothetical protein